LHAHEIVLKEARTMARLAAQSGDDGTNDVMVSELIRRNELQVWFVAEHLVKVDGSQYLTGLVPTLSTKRRRREAA
jgi:hypothetical protein